LLDEEIIILSYLRKTITTQSENNDLYLLF
jgi:hypothetical protein